HLRGLDEVLRYDTIAEGNRIGKVDDLLADTSNWIVRYLVVDTKLWRPGGQVLLSPQWVERVDWAEHSVFTDLSEDALRACPAYEPSSGVDRAFEERVHLAVGRPRYWI